MGILRMEHLNESFSVEREDNGLNFHDFQATFGLPSLNLADLVATLVFFSAECQRHLIPHELSTVLG